MIQPRVNNNAETEKLVCNYYTQDLWKVSPQEHVDSYGIITTLRGGLDVKEFGKEKYPKKAEM